MPNAPQTWLEYAKMEEERGHFHRCQQILTAGLHYCPLHEAAAAQPEPQPQPQP